MSDYLAAVLNYALEKHIGFECSNAFCPITPCASNPEARQIVINTNFHDPAQLPLQAAHEIGHVLNGHSGTLYLFTPSKRNQEAEANRTAIQILVPIFFSGLDPELANSQQFMEAFHVPSKLESLVEEGILSYYE